MEGESDLVLVSFNEEGADKVDVYLGMNIRKGICFPFLIKPAESNSDLRIFPVHLPRKTLHCVIAPAVAAFLMAFSAGCAAQIPDALKGSWQVAEVHINTGSSRAVSYGWNDPALHWRMFTFSDAQITDDAPEAGDCQTPQAKVTRMELGKLFGTSLTGDGYPVQQATPADYAFKSSPGEAVDVISLVCRNGLWQGGLGADGGPQGAWMYFTPDGHLILRWYDETLLVLERLPAHATPRASFDCTRAASPAEKALCGSLQLAAFDRSISAAYKIARNEVKDDAEQEKSLVASQREWVRYRDACSTDAACLLTSMKARLQQLAAVGQD